MSVEVPLFPLHTVLFPGGVLPLRIFEPRYLNMVSGCFKDDSPFAVVSIYQGQEAGAVESIYQTATLARIVDFDRLEDGLLGITCRGGQRVRILSQHARPDRLLLGQVEMLPGDPGSPLPASHLPLQELLRGILEREEMAFYSRFLDPDWDSAAWVGNRLGELLPLPVEVKQALLELPDPLRRLDVLLAVVQELSRGDD